MKNDEQAADRATTWIWGACLLAGWVLAFLAAFGIASTLLSRDLLPGRMDTNLRWDIAFLNATMGVLGMVAVLGVRRIVFGSWLGVRPWHLLIPLVGFAISIAHDLVLHEWVEARIGQYDFDHVAPTAVLSWTTILVAVSVFASLVAPRGRAFPPMTSLMAAVSIVLLITVMNAPGLGDGIEPESWTLAMLIGLSATYAIGCVLVAARQARRA